MELDAVLPKSTTSTPHGTITTRSHVHTDAFFEDDLLHIDIGQTKWTPPGVRVYLRCLGHYLTLYMTREQAEELRDKLTAHLEAEVTNDEPR